MKMISLNKNEEQVKKNSNSFKLLILYPHLLTPDNNNNIAVRILELISDHVYR